VREATRVHVVQACSVGTACVSLVVTVAESVGTVAESVTSFVPSVTSVAKSATSLAESVTSAAGLVTSVAGLAPSLAESNPVESVGVLRGWRVMGFEARCFGGLQKRFFESR
jgi:hypothetical protein